MDICFATNNLHKLDELKTLLEPEYRVLGLKEIGFKEELEENGSSLEENSRQKAWHIYRLFEISCFADDTGLEVEALNGEPGVFSARYAGDQKNNYENIKLLLRKMEGIQNRRARFRTVITLILKGKPYVFEGIVNGEIISSKRGSHGFGYDPIFVPENHSQTFAEMNMEEKNNISHRGKAVRKLAEFLKGQETERPGIGG